MRLQIVDTVLENVQAERVILLLLHAGGQLRYRQQSHEQVCDAVAQVQVIKHVFYELESSIIISQVEQQDLRHFEQPVRNDLVQVASEGRIELLSALFVNGVRCLVKTQKFVENLESRSHHQLNRVEQMVHHDLNLVRC